MNPPTMYSFEALSAEFAARFDTDHFPSQPSSLYAPAAYFLGLGGKRIRPVMCLMGNELFGEIGPDAWPLATAIELFHNFTLISCYRYHGQGPTAPGTADRA